MGLKYFHIRGYLFSNKIRGVAYFFNYFNNGSKNIKTTKINLQKTFFIPLNSHKKIKQKCLKDP